MKKLDKLVLQAMLPPYLLAFFVAEFVLVMQFLWKYIDEIVGKGISFFVLMELIFYFAVTIIPLAIPLTILISSVMVFGNLGESHELSSMKSAGISLIRIMMAAIVLSIFTAGFSLVASNYLKPKANYKFYYRFNSVRKQKPSLSITPLIFNNDFKDVVMRVGKKDPNGTTVEDVLIYDHAASDKSEMHLITAKHGEMYSPEDGKQFIIQLYDGIQYGDVKQNNRGKNKSSSVKPFVRTEFAEWRKVFDMTQFEMEAGNLNLTRKSYDLMNTFQLHEAIDSFTTTIDSLRGTDHKLFGWYGDSRDAVDSLDMIQKVSDYLPQIQDSVPTRSLRPSVEESKRRSIERSDVYAKGSPKFISAKFEVTDSTKSIIELYAPEHRAELMASTKGEAQKFVDRLHMSQSKVSAMVKDMKKHQLRFHQQYSWAFICIIFLFIGAPLGSIVKKGGYGYPLLFAIFFFMLFIIFNILGEKLAKGTLSPVIGAWYPCIILSPFAFYLTIRALNDSSFHELSTLKTFIAKLFKKAS